MAQLPISPSEIQLINQEIESLAEHSNEERIERKASIDQLKLQFEVLRSALNQLLPGFAEHYDKTYGEVVQSFDPESQHKAQTSPEPENQPSKRAG